MRQMRQAETLLGEQVQDLPHRMPEKKTLADGIEALEKGRQRPSTKKCNIARKEAMKRTCNRCHKPIAKTHRWHTIHHQFSIFGWTLLRWTTQEHRDCEHPTQVHKRVTKLEGEVPLPFMDYEEHA